MQGTLLGIAFILALLWLLLLIRRNKRESAAKPVTHKPDAKTAYHAVSIAYSENACLAAKQMTGRRFLANAAPRLPLPECNANECDCNFAHHADRRTGQDRRSPFGGSSAGATGTYNQERRNRTERRKNAK